MRYALIVFLFTTAIGCASAPAFNKNYTPEQMQNMFDEDLATCKEYISRPSTTGLAPNQKRALTVQYKMNVKHCMSKGGWEY